MGPSDNFTQKHLFYNNLSTRNSYFRPIAMQICQKVSKLSKVCVSVRQKTNICQSGNFQFDKFVQAIISLINAYFTTICPLKIPILDQLHCPSGNFQFDKLVQVTTSLKNAYFTTICPLKIPILDQLQCKFARKFQNFQKFVFFCLTNICHSLTNLSRWYFSARQKTNICQSGNFQFDKFVQAIILLKNTCFTTICPLEIPILDQLHCHSGNFQFDKFVQVIISLKNASTKKKYLSKWKFSV